MLNCRKKRCFGPRVLGGGYTPDVVHAFSNRTYFQACGGFWLSSTQRAPRVAGEKKKKKKIERIAVKRKSADKYVGQPNKITANRRSVFWYFILLQPCRNAARQDYVNAAVNQLSCTPLSSLLFGGVSGDAVITCPHSASDWLQLFRLMCSIMLMRLQELCKSCASLVELSVILFYIILFWRKVAKLLHNSCARVLFCFILLYCKWAFIILQMGEPL